MLRQTVFIPIPVFPFRLHLFIAHASLYDSLAKSVARARKMDFRPTNITVDKGKGQLEINWNDGLVSSYPLGHLREACPCVECRGGHANMGIENAPPDILKLVPRRSHQITGVSAVGNYALQPSWDDGHSTGIYTWEYLRHISPQQADE